MNRILILDDDVALLDLCQRLLMERGWMSDRACTVEEAESLIKKNSDYSLLICDLKLPDGNGEDFIKAFWRVCPQAKVVVVTEFPKRLVETKINSGDLARVEYLMKPYDFEDLLKRVKNLLETK